MNIIMHKNYYYNSLSPAVHVTLTLTLILLITCNIVTSVSSHNHCHKPDRDALLSFKNALLDPSSRLTSWLAHNCCSWPGIICHNNTARVIQIRLRNTPLDEGLGGQISASLLHLKHLHYLDLSSNNFQRIRIPEFLGSLHYLTYLNLSNANFAGGPIPQTIGALSFLRYLDLSSYTSDQQEYNTNLDWLSGLHSLEYLNLGTVYLSDGWLQQVNMLPFLRELYLPSCGLSVLPFSLSYVNFSSLSALDLSNNGFASFIPMWIFNLSRLSYLNLGSNTLQGTIPPAFSNLTSLQMLDLSENYPLGGELSNNLASLCHLRKLDLSVNNFTGPITQLVDGFSNCPNRKLEILNLGYNLGLQGVIPRSIGELRNLKYLALRENSFIGSIPDSIGNLSLLEELYLMNPRMNGTPPESMGNLSSLVALELSEVPLEGVMTEAHFKSLKSLKELSIYKFSLVPKLSLVLNISKQWIPPFKLSFLKLRSCQVGPGFPAWLRNQNELRTFYLRNTGINDNIPDWLSKLNLELNELDLGYNQIRGRIPESVRFSPGSTVYLNWNLFQGPLPLFSSNVSALYLSNNSFTGPIPVDIGDRLPLLTDLDLSQNSLNGSIPLSIGKLSSLTTLILSNNLLSGTISDFWENLSILYLVELSNNSLTGRIPSSLGSLIGLKFLMLNNNLLSGNVPNKLQSCTEMVTLDLGENRFSGTLPAWIGEKMPSLLILRLRSNTLHGIIPWQFCKLASIHILDLADNHLSGVVPSCFKDLDGMKFDLDTERYEGQLQVVTKGRKFLYKNTLFLVNSIDLSSNNLSGKIPPGIGELHRLGTVNLSNNHLTGRIPEKIGQLQIMETLDLSRNQLTGQIPASMTDLTSLNHLNLSYNNLWGRIPTSNQFGTLIDPSIYTGNAGLCGFPLVRSCGTKESPSPPAPNSDTSKKSGFFLDNLGVFVSAGLGFIVGFWGICGTLIVNASWRNAYYRFFGEAKDQFVVNSSRLWRMIQNK